MSMSTPARRRRRTWPLMALTALASSLPVALAGPAPVVHAGALQQIAFESTPDALVTLGNLASRTQRQPVTRAGLGPYTISGTDSRTSQPYSFTTDEPYDPVSRAAYGNEGDEGIVSSTFSTVREIIATDAVDNTRTNVVRLFSNTNCVNQNNLGGVPGYCSLFGPEIWTAPFTASPGQAVSFDWRASGASDDYEIYAFLVRVTETSPGVFDYGDEPAHTLLTYSRGDTQGWTTSSANVPSAGTYRFRFVNGSYDGTGGLALGSEMFIDSVVKLGLANPISFAPLGDKIVDSAPFALTATSPSGPVTFASTTPGVCTVSGSTVTLVASATGVCSIVADQAGDGVDYVPASSVVRSFRVLSAPTAPTNIGLPTITGGLVAGQFLSATQGTWADGGSPITGITLQWQQTIGGNTTDIAGATSGACFLVAEPGATLRVVATATNAIGSTSANSAATASGFTCGTPPTPTAAVTFDAEAGDQAGSADAKVNGTGSGLLPGSTVTLTLQPGGTVLGTAVVGPNGTFDTEVQIPSGLAAGSYSVVLDGTAWNGQALTDTGWFALEVGGGIAGVSEVGPVSTAPGFVGITPTRLLDTRTGVGQAAAQGSVTEVSVTSVSGLPADGAAVVLNVTVDGPAAAGFVTAYPCGTARPLASSVNFLAGQTISNSVTVAVGTGGKVCLFSSRATHLVVDAMGAYSQSSGQGRLNGLTPSRLLDTRDAGTKLERAAVREIQVTGRGGVDAAATSVVLNVTATEPDASGFFTVFPCGVATPWTSNVNFVAGQTVASAVTTAIGTGGKVCVSSSASSHLVVDVTGDYVAGRPTGALGTTTIERLLDTREASSPTAGAPLAARTIQEVQVSGRAGVPAGAAAVVLNVTVDAPAGPGFVTVFPCGTSVPLASNVNFVAGQTVSNAVTTALGTGGKVCVYSMTTAHVVVDVNASFVGTV